MSRTASSTLLSVLPNAIDLSALSPWFWFETLSYAVSPGAGSRTLRAYHAGRSERHHARDARYEVVASVPTAQSNPNDGRCLHAGRGLAWADQKYLRIVSCGSIIIRIGDVDPAWILQNFNSTSLQHFNKTVTE